MKRAARFLLPLLMVPLVLCSCENSTENSGVSLVPAKAYKEYYYRGPRPQTDTTLYIVTTSKGTFDLNFMYLGFSSPPDTIPRADLDTQVAFSIVKYGYRTHSLDLALATLRADTLQIEYTSAVLSTHPSFTVAQSLVIMVNSSFRAVRFYENGQPVRTVP